MLLNYSLCFSVSTCVLLAFSSFFFKYSTMVLIDSSFSYKCKRPVAPVTTSKAGRLHSQVEKQCINETWYFISDRHD